MAEEPQQLKVVGLQLLLPPLLLLPLLPPLLQPLLPPLCLLLDLHVLRV